MLPCLFLIDAGYPIIKVHVLKMPTDELFLVIIKHRAIGVGFIPSTTNPPQKKIATVDNLECIIS